MYVFLMLHAAGSAQSLFEVDSFLMKGLPIVRQTRALGHANGSCKLRAKKHKIPMGASGRRLQGRF